MVAAYFKRVSGSAKFGVIYVKSATNPRSRDQNDLDGSCFSSFFSFFLKAPYFSTFFFFFFKCNVEEEWRF